MSVSNLRFDSSAFFQRHGPTLALCIGLWLTFAFFETLKTLYFAYNKALVAQYAVHSLYIFLPWCVFSLLCGLLTERTIAYSLSSPRFLFPHLLTASAFGLLHLMVLTSSYWVFLPWIMEEKSFGDELLRRSVSYFHLEIIAYFVMVAIWRTQFKAAAESEQTCFDSLRGSAISGALDLITRGGITRVLAGDIEWLIGDGNYIVVHTAEQELRVRSTFKAILDQLDTENFMRTHRSVVVNLAKIQRVEKQRLVLESGTRVPVSRRRYHELVNRLGTCLINSKPNAPKGAA